MKKASFRKISLVGVVLVAASAVTAAVLPKNDKSEKLAGPGRLEQSSVPSGANYLTCIADQDAAACNPSAGQFTSTSQGQAVTSATPNSSQVGIDDFRHSSGSPL